MMVQLAGAVAELVHVLDQDSTLESTETEVCKSLEILLTILRSQIQMNEKTIC